MYKDPNLKKFKLLILIRLLLVPIGVFLALLLLVQTENCRNRNKSLTTSNSPDQSKLPGSLLEPDKKSVQLKDIVFPENFFFGTASSDFQTTGGNGLSDWNEYIKGFKPPLVGPDNGTDFLNRYKEDFDLAEKFGDQVHRLSLEWARIEPEEGKWNQEAIRKYREILLYLKSKGVEPMLCLNHFALPLWMAEKGGLESPQFPFYYSRYAKVVAQEIGLPLKINWWLTFNEPQVMLIPYTKGVWPPNKPIKNFQDTEGVERALKVASNIIDAHKLSYRVMHGVLKSRKVMVSYASAPALFYPHNPDSPLDQIAYNIGNALDTLAFDYAAGKVDRDFIGLNYYGRAKLTFDISVPGVVLPSWLTEKKPFAIEWEMPVQRKQGDRPKEFYPKALYDLIMKFKIFDLPIVITENGLSDPEDKFREEFIVIHLKAVHDAMREGAPVIGYQYWALTDTWEWDGVFSQMGLVAIDRKNNFERKLRPSALTYGKIIKTRTLSKELLEKHKELLSQN